MPNRLAQETSPYLLQHADNPVDRWLRPRSEPRTSRRAQVPGALSPQRVPLEPRRLVLRWSEGRP
ncbi:DUF255 domain-containing protein [Streptomyces lydicus]|nr:DUF255 domain-containing protein [Streptomyces lydicus]MCZ1007760.1 DUF255 domain-containing protein [Streptomyces lydicus]